MSDMTPDLAVLVARRFAVLGEPMRLRLLDALHQREEASVGDLAEMLGGTHANVSKHLNVLLAERMVGRRRDGSRALYRITDATLIRLCEEVCTAVRESVRELSVMIGEEGAAR